MNRALLTTVRDGQRYVDRPVCVMPRPDRLTPIAQAVTVAFDAAAKPPRPLVVRHERIALRWMKPDGKGGLVPK